jgi:dolichol-phosphate mannosyltransferase
MIFFLIPIFNEEQNLLQLSESIRTVKLDSDFITIMVDDGSTDKSHEIAQKCFSDLNLIYLFNEKNSGPGFSFNHGFEYILEQYGTNESDLIVTLEGDNTSDIHILPTMIMLARRNFDLVLASVYAQGGEIKNSSFLRKTLSLGANLFIRVFFDIKVLTMSSFYRVYKIETVAKIKEKYEICVQNNGFLSQIELIIKSIGVNAKIIEVPMILDSSKREGKSKMKVFKTGLEYFKFFIRHGINKKTFK